MPLSGKHSMTTLTPANSSSRWCPTPEQLMILEEMYRAGIRTPNASQIQHITAQLSLYGKIEGKNVFYWFQNHKARDRQKLRRKLCKQLQQQQLLYNHHHNYHNYHNNPYHHHHHHQQQQQQQQQSLLGYLDHLSPPASSSTLQQLSNCHNYSSAGFLPPPQVGVEDALMKHAWKMEIPQRVEMEKSVMSMYGRDWMMMMMGMWAHPLHVVVLVQELLLLDNPSRPFQLFPITATNLKEESSPSSSNPSLSSTTPTPNY
ncbi:unnamed protein product [Prunus armeniaca]|uniref:Homeobox domain-containing protein n=1 Tax=Prunus armeniaca TaxID=36596 RepID=A0A6J5XPY1_PRUAR|nr:unnamed protein product [Prunus armeniaca]